MALALCTVDLHSHVLPGLDDGPASEDESLEMCRAYEAQGIHTVVATPHTCDPRYDVDPQAILDGVACLSDACAREEIDVRVLPGAEVRLHADLLRDVDSGRALTIADRGRYLLLELPPQVAPRIEPLVGALLRRGVAPVLAHVERNMELSRKPQRLVELVEAGCLAQVTGASVLGWFGPAAKTAALQFLRAGLVHVVATDAHGMRRARSPELALAAEAVAHEAGADTARETASANPEHMVGAAPGQSQARDATRGANGFERETASPSASGGDR